MQRWVKMCKHLSSLGWNPVVYTPENPALTAIDETLAAEIPPQVEVLRRKILEPGQLKGARKSTLSQVNPINSGKKNLKQKIALWIRGNCFIPDPRVLWVRPSVRFLTKYLQEHPVDAIISTGPPHSMHLVARGVSLRTGIPYVADFRDPWTKMFYFKHLGLTKASERKHGRMEREVLRDAAAIIAVSPLVQQEFAQMTSTPVALVTNGFDEDDFRGAMTPSKDRFTLAHAGLLAADGDPLCVWDALRQLCDEESGFAGNLHLRLAGKTDAAVLQSIRDRGLEDKLENLGYVDHKKAVGVMREASVLLLPLRREPEYRCVLPGKTFEYMASGRPVVGIGQTDGAMAALIGNTHAGVCFEWEDTAGVKEHILQLYRKWQEDALKANTADLSAYSRRGTAAQVAALLDSLCAEDPQKK